MDLRVGRTTRASTRASASIACRSPARKAGRAADARALRARHLHPPTIERIGALWRHGATKGPAHHLLDDAHDAVATTGRARSPGAVLAARRGSSASSGGGELSVSRVRRLLALWLAEHVHVGRNTNIGWARARVASPTEGPRRKRLTTYHPSLSIRSPAYPRTYDKEARVVALRRRERRLLQPASRARGGRGPDRCDVLGPRGAAGAFCSAVPHFNGHYHFTLSATHSGALRQPVRPNPHRPRRSRSAWLTSSWWRSTEKGEEACR